MDPITFVVELQAEISDPLGAGHPRVDLYIARGGRRYQILSEPINPDYQGGVEDAALGIIGDALAPEERREEE